MVGKKSPAWPADTWSPQASFQIKQRSNDHWAVGGRRLLHWGSRGLCTFSQRLHGDDLTAVASSGGSHCHHPDAILSIPTQVRNSVGKWVRGGFKLADDLWGEKWSIIHGSKWHYGFLKECLLTYYRSNQMKPVSPGTRRAGYSVWTVIGIFRWSIAYVTLWHLWWPPTPGAIRPFIVGHQRTQNPGRQCFKALLVG